jgi:membrane protease YdiL (CAAX protease family)
MQVPEHKAHGSSSSEGGSFPQHDRDARVGSRVGQTRARMQPMTSLLRRASSRLLDSTPNYVEVTAVLAVALIARLLYLPEIWKAGLQPCVVVALFVSVFLYVCVDRGRLFTYFGWAKPARAVSWLYALLSGVLVAIGVLSVVRLAHMSLGGASRERLLYGVTLGPILEELLFRGAVFSVIYVTASSVKSLARLRITLTIIGSSLLFALAHTNTVGIPLFLFLGTGTLYAMLRWRSNSTATAALMHATYNAMIALAMLHA